MICEQYREWISFYIDGVLENEEKIAFENHLKTCKECRQELEEIQFLIEEIQKIPEKTLPEDYHKDLMLKLYKERDEKKSEKKKLDFNLKKLTAVAASFLLLFFIMTSIGNMGMKSEQNGVAGEFEAAKQSYSKNEIASSDSFKSSAELAKTDMASDYGGMAADYSMESLEEESINQAGNTFNAVSVDAGERKIIYNAYLSLEVELFDDTVKAIRELTQKSGGYVENFSSYIYYSEPERDIYLKEGTIVIRIPVEKYGDVSNELVKLGHLISQNEMTENITEQYIETESRIRMLELEQERLLEIMEKAEEVEDLIKLEERLNQVRTNLEIYKSMIKNWDKLVEFSTFTITIKEVKTIEPIKMADPNLMARVKSNFNRSINDVRQTFEDFVVSLSYALIPLLLLIVILGITFMIARPIFKKIIKMIHKRRDE
ncbi:MAG: DUF4349 domain-containing protein [Epulopiscium sp.]|nr:DUF4349 domain-containing protein [Candidatus Epulonipiscium sp.]